MSRSVLCIGDTVVVGSWYSDYSKRHEGKSGVVKRTGPQTWGRIGVLLDGERNSRSQTGVFWFSPGNLKLVKSDNGSKERQSKEERLMVGNYRVVHVSYGDSGPFTACADYLGVQKGELVVVMSGHHGMVIARVIEVTGPDGGPIQDNVRYGRQIVDRINTSGYEARIEAEKEYERIKTTMDARVKELQKIAVFEMLAEKDDKLKELLEHFRSLDAAMEKKDE